MQYVFLNWSRQLIRTFFVELIGFRPCQCQGQDLDMGTEELQPRTKGNKVAPKKVARRGGSFTKEEDRIICSAFLNVNKDPITGEVLQLLNQATTDCYEPKLHQSTPTGVNQSTGGYYKRIHEYFKEHKPEGSERSQIAIQHRWVNIQKAVNKFCGLKSAIDRRNESRKKRSGNDIFSCRLLIQKMN